MKRLIPIFCLFCSILFCTSSCKKSTETALEQSGIILNKDSASIHLKAQFDQWTVLLCQDLMPYMDTLQNFYSHRNYNLLWWDAILGDSASWAKVENTIAHSKNHGMDSRYYYLSVVDYYRKQIPNLSTADSAYRYIAECELILANAHLKMYEDIANGRTHPKNVYGYTYMLPLNNLKKLDFEAYLNTNNKITALENIHITDSTYQELLSVLHYYLTKEAEAKSSFIDFTDYPKLKVGDSAEIVLKVIQKLKARNLPDSSIHELPDTALFTKELRSKIKILQGKYQLTPDGVMGYKTYKLINTSPKDKINQVRANLERQRWFNKPQIGPFAYINMPKYTVDMHWKDSMKSMKICIGKNLPDNYDAMVKTYTDSGWLYKLPKNMETPQIASRITYMVLNPTWTVPYSIVKREMWPKLVKDPSYLKKKGYKVFRKKEEVDSDTIQWSLINKNRIPYTIVQDPGPKNSLGTVKYMFNNPFSIYLHDTPSKGAFGRTQRAVSHGCVRLQKPVLFGEFLMQNSRKYNPDDFRIMMGYAPKDNDRRKKYDPTDSTAKIRKLEETSKINLEKSMPLYLDYRTVYYDKQWNLHFAYDIYDQNKLITQAMDRY